MNKKIIGFALVLAFLLSACQTSKSTYLKRRKTKKCNCPTWGMIQN